jgi:hypothetical protein
MLALNERSGHQDLRGSGRQSVILYVHGRMEVVLFKCGLFLSVALSGLESSNARCNLLYHKATAVTLRPRARQVAPGQLDPIP